MEGKNIIDFAKKYVGCKYVLGALAPKDDANYKGPFDCAEFVAFCIYQVFGFLYGCNHDDVLYLKTTDAYTGYFASDAKKLGRIVSVDEAINTPGALLLRVPQPGVIGHIVISQGNGKTVEAHSTKMGVIESVANGRRWDYGILLPGLKYELYQGKFNIKSSHPIVYRLTQPNMVGDYVGKIQRALHIPADCIFGQKTANAVEQYQRDKGLIVDGEVMPGGETSRALGIN